MKNQLGPRPEAAATADAEKLSRAYGALDSEPAKAVAELTTLAQRGSTMSMLYLGYALRNGIGSSQDVPAAESWLRQAANAGSFRANYDLGRLFLDLGRYPEAKREFEYAASAGFIPGVHFLGRIYYFGFGVPVDVDRGKSLLKRASEWGCVYAKAMLAHDLIHREKNVFAVLKGVALKLECYFDLIWIIWKEGFTSDRLR